MREGKRGRRRQIRTQICMISLRDNMARIFGQISMIWKKSGLTEEHEQPICLRFPSTSSDSTENSSKGKRDFSHNDGGHGNVIRIRLAPKKQNYLCSTSGRTKIPVQDKDEIRHISKQEAICILTEENSKFGRGFATRTDKELVCLISKDDAAHPDITGTSSVPVAVRSSKQALTYNKLIETWLPRQLEDKCLYTDDLDWLFSGNNQGDRAKKRLKSECDSMSYSSSSMLWQPHARFLPEVDIHALPFTVPFT